MDEISDRRREYRFAAGDRVTVRGIADTPLVGEVCDRSIRGIGVKLPQFLTSAHCIGDEVNIENQSGIVRSARIRHRGTAGRLGLEWVYRLGEEPTA